MKIASKSSCFIYLTAFFATQLQLCDSKSYYVIDNWGDLCWTISGESDQIQPNDRIVLADCNKSDDRQLFWINSYYLDFGCVYFADFHPKLNETLVVGVNQLVERKRLRLQEPKTNNSAQLFYFDEHGVMGMGTDPRCMDEIWGWYDDDEVIEVWGHCLLVTSQGTHPSPGKIIHLKTIEEIVLKPNANNHWWMYDYLVGDSC